MWGSALTFSNMPLSRLIYFFSAVLLENHLVFVSSNTSLLTSTIMTMKALIKPFQWSFPCLPIVPMDFIEMMDSPFPVILGINNTKEWVNKRNLAKRHSDCLFIYLDEPGVTFVQGIESARNIVVPYFSNFQQRLSEHYKIFQNPFPEMEPG